MTIPNKYYTNKKIEEINEKLDNPDLSDKEIEELEDELDSYEYDKWESERG